jgi:MFS transporter, ACS family, glucarate transporter
MPVLKGPRAPRREMDMDQNMARPTHIRHLILSMLFVVSTISYADRSVLSIAGTSIEKALVITPTQLGFIFSSFSIAYVIAQVPGGFAIDRFGARLVYACALVLWSLFTLLQGFAGLVEGAAAVSVLFAMRFLVGLASAPGVPANARIVANWFPSAERGTASAIFNATQYFAPFAFNGVLGVLVHEAGWPYPFFFMGVLGLAAALVFLYFVKSPTRHSLINKAEFDFIAANGALVNVEDAQGTGSAAFTWANVKQVLANRMLIGIYIGQYCINVLTYFFITWFPPYLMQQRHMDVVHAGFWSAVPAACGFVGGVLGGVVSDWLLKRTGNITLARKMPLLFGMLLATLIIACNYTDSQAMVILFMALAFFGKGVASLGWAVISDTSPRQLIGVTGGIFNMAGNLAGVVMPIVVGYIVSATKSYDLALVFVGAHCILTIMAYFLIVQKIERLELKPA